MVKGISRQVIVVNAPDQKLFEQAIFILKEEQPVVNDEMLLKEAQRLIGMSVGKKKQKLWIYGSVWATGGALVTGVLWLISALA